MGRRGTLIFSHHNVRERLVSGAFLGAFNMKQPATRKAGLPVVTFSKNLKFHLNGETVMVKHVPHAHTDGDKLLRLSDDNTKIIAGHGPLATKQDLVNYRQMLGTAYERLNKLKAEGKTAQEAAAQKPLADLEETWGKGMFTGDRWIELIYPGV
jgi:glyoxylase-like metal-dependent hydrolase (beta-lactamase superfamily II)